MCSQSWLCCFLLVCQLRNRTPRGPCLDPCMPVGICIFYRQNVWCNSLLLPEPICWMPDGANMLDGGCKKYFCREQLPGGLCKKMCPVPKGCTPFGTGHILVVFEVGTCLKVQYVSCSEQDTYFCIRLQNYKLRSKISV